MSGWGYKENGGMADVLQYALVHFTQNRSTCVEGYRNLPKMKNITDNMLCAGGIEADSCSGDSGGPLSCFKRYPPINPDNLYLCGIVSFGVGCKSGRPGIYTDVSKYYKWIKDHMAIADRQLWGK